MTSIDLQLYNMRIMNHNEITISEAMLFTDVRETLQEHAQIVGIIPGSYDATMKFSTGTLLVGDVLNGDEQPPYTAVIFNYLSTEEGDVTYLLLKDNDDPEAGKETAIIKEDGCYLLSEKLPRAPEEYVQLLRYIFKVTQWDPHKTRIETMAFNLLGQSEEHNLG